jgi:hypothetical protein
MSKCRHEEVTCRVLLEGSWETTVHPHRAADEDPLDPCCITEPFTCCTEATCEECGETWTPFNEGEGRPSVISRAMDRAEAVLTERLRKGDIR